LNNVSSANFGLLIAYVLPGFVLLWGLQPFVANLDLVLGSAPGTSLTMGEFLNTTVAAIAAGMTVSTVRWLIIDTIHHATGIRPPKWDFALLGDRAEAFGLVVEHYYRYFQFHANTFISLLIVFGLRHVPGTPFERSFGLADLGLLAVMVLFFAGSRDSLRRYYRRGGQLLKQNGSAAGQRAQT
jgi:hypothetical protein